MKNKWLYKIPLVALASTVIAPMIVSCSVEKPKVETQEEKEKRLEHQRALQIAPNLTKFLDDYYDEEKYYREGRDINEMKTIENIKELRELTSNINHLNEFEKSYLGLYEDIQNFFDNSIHRYTKDNVVFDYWYRPNDDRENESFYTHIKLDENTITQEQMFYHKIYQIMNDENYSWDNIEINEKTQKHFKEALFPLINEKIEEFAKKHKDFQFKNPNLTFKKTEKGLIIEMSLEVEYQNQKLPEIIVFPLTFNIKPERHTILRTEKKVKELFKKSKEIIKENENEGMQRKDVKTLDELKQLFATKPNEWNNEEIKETEKHYNKLINEINEDDKEVEM